MEPGTRFQNRSRPVPGPVPKILELPGPGPGPVPKIWTGYPVLLTPNNTYSFRFENKNITLTSRWSTELFSSPSPKPSPTSSSPVTFYALPPIKGTISLLQYKPF